MRGNGPADLEYQPTAGTEGVVGLRDEAFDDLETSRPSEDGLFRLEFANLELDLIFFRFADVGRVGDDEIELFWRQASKEIGLVKADLRCEGVTSGVGPRDLQGFGGDVGGVDFRIGQFFCQGESDCAGAGADVGNAEGRGGGFFSVGRGGAS